MRFYIFNLKGDCNGGMFSELTNCCNATHPCNIGQGDCDADEDCLGNLVCGRQNCGPGFFWNSTDCCTTLVGTYLCGNRMFKHNTKRFVLYLMKQLSCTFQSFRFYKPGVVFNHKNFELKTTKTFAR